MSSETANVDLLKHAYRQWSETRGDPEVFLALADCDIKFGSMARGECAGREEASANAASPPAR